MYFMISNQNNKDVFHTINVERKKQWTQLAQENDFSLNIYEEKNKESFLKSNPEYKYYYFVAV